MILTKKEILAHLDNTPLMNSIRSGTLEQILKMKQDLNRQIMDRKTATWRSFFWNFIKILIVASICVLILNPSLPGLLFIHIGSQIIFAFVWYFTTATRFRKAKRLEYVLLTVMDAAIAEKKAALAAATNS